MKVSSIGPPAVIHRFVAHRSHYLDGGFFVFGDLSIKVEGEYRLEFTLYEQQK